MVNCFLKGLFQKWKVGIVLLKSEVWYGYGVWGVGFSVGVGSVPVGCGSGGGRSSG